MLISNWVVHALEAIGRIHYVRMAEKLDDADIWKGISRMHVHYASDTDDACMHACVNSGVVRLNVWSLMMLTQIIWCRPPRVRVIGCVWTRVKHA
jgi:hypothetical protein